jgi:hypothetical protein
MYRQALELFTRVLGPEHPDTISSINNLAGCLGSQVRCMDVPPQPTCHATISPQAIAVSALKFGRALSNGNFAVPSQN